MVYEHLHETLISGILVVRISTDAAHPVVSTSIGKSKFHQVNTIRIRIQFFFDWVSHLQVSSRKT
jgi:hypothetical protein